MLDKMIRLITKLSHFGVVHREDVKNDIPLIDQLIRRSIVRKVHRDRKVYYELTEKALPLLESRRKAEYEEAKILALLHKPPSVFHALIGDLRFLDEKHAVAQEFLFLGDWQIKRPVVVAQLKLAQLRYYRGHR